MEYEKQINTLVKICKKYKAIDDIRTVLEIGARDGKETRALRHFFPKAKIHSFECNPSTVPLWKKNAESLGNVACNEMAVCDSDGELSFFSIDQEKTQTTWSDGNPGASSLFKASGDYPVEQYVQKEVKVKSTRLDTYIKNGGSSNESTGNAKNSVELPIDLIWMDIQGAELSALQGAGERIGDIRIIHTEVEFFPIYENQPLLGDIKKFVNSKGFLLCHFTSFGQYSGDAVFINKKVFAGRPVDRLFCQAKDALLWPAYSAMRFIKKSVRSAIKVPMIFAKKAYMKFYRKFIFAKNEQKVVEGFKALAEGKRTWTVAMGPISRSYDIPTFAMALKDSPAAPDEKTLILQIKYGGLGDHLFYSHIPRIAKETKAYDRVLISNKSEFRHPDYKRIVWETNPHIDGFTDLEGRHVDAANPDTSKENLLDRIMLDLGLDDGKRFHEPELHYAARPVSDVAGKTLYDPNYVSNVGLVTSAKINEYMKAHGIQIDAQMALRNRSIPVDNFNDFVSTGSLEDFMDVICSAGDVYCLASGTATLASALGKKVHVFSGKDQHPMFRHSKNNSYIIL